MNFGSGVGGGGGGGGGGGATAGSDLDQIDTEQLAFQSASGDDNLRLLPMAWPADNLPPTTASLLSVASTTGLVAAAGPETLIIASTESVRQSLCSGAADGNKVKSFTPQATIQIPRVSQLAFSSDESCLVIAAEQGGGLAVYGTNTLTNGGTEPAFHMATEAQSVRQLVPNPNPSPDLSRYFAVVTSNGQLLLADLKEQKLVQSTSGSPVFHEKVSCACWSRLGKQIVAGLADGTAVQIDQQGVVKAHMPEPPQLAQWKDPSAIAHPITSIFWLETYDFLIIHTPINKPASGGNDDSIYHLAHRDKTTSSWTFSKFTDPCPPFGMERRPAQHFIQRLREWLDLSDLLVLSSTASADIGIFTRSKLPLNSEHPVTESYTYTEPPDSRRAAMPMGGDGSDTSPIGMAIDLSVNEKIARPIPNDETLDQSPVPLPALYVLNNEGMLRMWYIIYNNSVREGKPYPDLIAAGGPRPLGEQKAQQQQVASPPGSSAGDIGATTPNAQFGQSQQSTVPFGVPSAPKSTFGQPSTPAFGGASFLGQKQSPWASNASSSGTTSFQQPSFGSSTFGQASGIGMNKGSVWGAPQQQQQAPSTTNVFGGNAAQSSPFMSLGNNQQGSSSFASLSKDTQSPFASAGKSNLSSGSSGSAFSSLGKENQSSQSPFGSTASKPNLSAEPSGSTISFGNGTSFGSGSTNFGVTSFQSSPTPTPQQAQSREESMADNEDGSETSTLKAPSQAPATGGSSGGGLFGLGPGGFKLGSTFKGDGTATDDLPKPKNPGAGLFGADFGESLSKANDTATRGTDKKDESGSGSEAAWMSGASTPVVKKEPSTEDVPKLSDIPPAPAESTEDKAAPVDDAPLPPDPTTWKPKPGALPPPIPPGFGTDFAKPAEKKDEKPKDTSAPAAPAKEAAEKPLAGSPPVDLGKEEFSKGPFSPAESMEAAGPPEDDDEEGDWSDDDEQDDEGVGEDEENRTPKVIDQKGLSAFEARLTPASPKRGEQQSQANEESTTPSTDQKSSYTPSGLPKAPIMFPPPQRTQESPRSPSPQRSATSPARSMARNFSTSQQAAANTSQPLGKQSSQSTVARPSQLPPPSQPRTSSLLQGSTEAAKSTSQSPLALPKTQQPPQRISVPPSQLAKPEKPSASLKAVEPQEGELEDEEDARIQTILAAPIEPSRELPSFLAHQDYVISGTEKEGLGGQIERVFRDINSMIDTLALNARSLRGFLDGNYEDSNGRELNRLDLEDEESWLLGEASSLQRITEGIDVELEDGRIEDVRGAIEGLKEEETEIAHLRNKTAEARKAIAARSDPDQLAAQHGAPLSMESQAQQSELRQGVQKVQQLLAKAEEQLSVLRAELASISTQGAGRDGKSNVPTVEAVTNTILKMTAMIEKKSGDIDVLESRIKKLGGPAAIGLKADYEEDLAAGLKASRLSNGSPAALRFRASRSTPGSIAKKSLFDVSDQEVEAYRRKKEGRRRAMEKLREQLEVRGPRVVKVGR